MPSSLDRPDRPIRGAGAGRDKPSGSGAPRTGTPRVGGAPRTAGAGYQGGERSGAARGGAPRTSGSGYAGADRSGAPRTGGSGYQGSAPRTGGSGYQGGERSGAPRSGGSGYQGGERSGAPRSGGSGYQGGERSAAPRTGGSGYQGSAPRSGGSGYQGGDRSMAPRAGGSTRPSGSGYEGNNHRDAYNPPGRGGAPRGGGMERGQWQQGQPERTDRRPDTRPDSRPDSRPDTRSGGAPSTGRDSYRGSPAPSRGGSPAPSRGGYAEPSRSTRAQVQSRNDSAASLRAARGEEAPADRPKRSFDGPSDRPARSFDRPARSSDRPARSFDGPSDRPTRSSDRPARSFDGPSDRPTRSFNTQAARPDRAARPFDGSSARPARNADSGSARSAERPGRSFNQAPERGTRPLGTPGRPSSNHQDRPAVRMGGTGASRTEIEQREYDPRREARRTAARVELPEDVEARMLDPEVRQELRSLSKDTADLVARHLVMTGRLLDDEPELALAHARAARAMAARVGAVREAAGLAAYTTGDWTDALSELRAARRITGQPGHLAVMADCERALGRPERALALGEDRDVARLTQEERVELVIVVSGARRDLGQCDAAVLLLQDPAKRTTAKRPFAARLWYAYADALLDAGRQDEGREWFAKVVEVDQTGQTDAHERMLDLDGVQFEDLEDDGDEDEVHAWIEPDTAMATAGLQAAFARLEVDETAVDTDAQDDSVSDLGAEGTGTDDDGTDGDDSALALAELTTDDTRGTGLNGDQPPWQAPVDDDAEPTAVAAERRDAGVPSVTFQSDDQADEDGVARSSAAADDDMRLFE